MRKLKSTTLLVSGLICSFTLTLKAALAQETLAQPANPGTPNTESSASTATDAKEAGTTSPTPKSTLASASSPTKPAKDLPNFHEVHPFLYRGGEPTHTKHTQLKSMGVSTVIDLRAPTEKALDEKREAHKLGMRYINLVMDSHAPTEKQVQTMLTTIDQAKKASESGKKDSAVFVHCAHGSDRTGCMIGIWRVTREGWDYLTTYKEMRKYYFTPKFTQLSGAVEKYAAAEKTKEKHSE